MRVPLPQLRTNGHAAALGRAFVISGLCQNPRFRLTPHRSDAQDFCLIYMGTPGGANASAESSDAGADPYFILRRTYDGGSDDHAAIVALRVDWEGIFTMLSNDDAAAEALYADLIAPSSPEEVNRQWSEDPSTLAMFAEMLHLG